MTVWIALRQALSEFDCFEGTNAVFNAHRAPSLLVGELESFCSMMLEEEQWTMLSRGTSMEGPVRLNVYICIIRLTLVYNVLSLPNEL